MQNDDPLLLMHCQSVAFSHQQGYIDGLVQDCSNSSALAMDLLQSCTTLWICLVLHVMIPWPVVSGPIFRWTKKWRHAGGREVRLLSIWYLLYNISIECTLCFVMCTILMMYCIERITVYSDQCWRIICKVQWHSSQGNFMRDISALNHKTCLKITWPKISSKSPRGQWVKLR